MISRRYQRIAFKLLVLIPLIWITVAFFIYFSLDHYKEQNGRHYENRIRKEKNVINEMEEKSYERSSLENTSSVGLTLPGSFGQGVEIKNPDNKTAELIAKGWKNHAFNQYVSDIISLHRSLPDPRDDWCKEPNRFLNIDKLPSTSVVICFHNEAWSTLIRTLNSVLERSPDSLVDKVILVDDASTMDHLKLKLNQYIKQFSKVKIVRLKFRMGLIRARLAGFSHVSSPTATFLDSHCECAEGWLVPLLDRIKGDPTRVVCPVIDVIDAENFKFNYQSASGVSVGGFDWNLQFNWHAVPKAERDRHSSSSEALASPTMAGGLFTIDTEFFKKLGTYDSGFDIWGGENLELSFKAWMCGGSLETVPCSHVGHIFRSRSPYQWRSGVNVLRRNTVRLAEVWLDDYKKYYYDRIGHDLGDFGNISERVELRKKLKCKSFQWYLDNVYPQLFIPGEAVAYGEIRNTASAYCIDSPAKPEDNHKPLGLWPCHNQGGNQYWMLSKEGEIRRDESCVDYDSVNDIILYPCHGSRGNQEWEYDSEKNVLRHTVSHKCLAISSNHEKLSMMPCDYSNINQNWIFGTFQKNISRSNAAV